MKIEEGRKKFGKQIAEVLTKCMKDKDFREEFGNVYAIIDPQFYYKFGFPPEFVDLFVDDHYSSDDNSTLEGHKETIYVNKQFGDTRRVANGVFHLDFVEDLARMFGYTSELRGRGARGRVCLEFLEKKFTGITQQQLEKRKMESFKNFIKTERRKQNE